MNLDSMIEKLFKDFSWIDGHFTRYQACIVYQTIQQ